MEFIIVTETIILFSMVLWFIRRKREENFIQKRNEIWNEENYKNQVRRLKAIRNRCNKYLDSVPTKLQTPDRQILVTYEDLVMIWHGTHHIEDYL